MSGTHNSDPTGLTESDFVNLYGDISISMGNQKLPLTTALAMEEAFCTADQEKREDPADRLAFLAQKIGEDLLHPEHRYLLGQSTSSES